MNAMRAAVLPEPRAGHYLEADTENGTRPRPDLRLVHRADLAVAVPTFPQVTLPAVINGAAGVVTAADGRPITLVAFTITGTKSVAIDLTDDPRHIAEADLAILGR